MARTVPLSIGMLCNNYVGLLCNNIDHSAVHGDGQQLRRGPLKAEAVRSQHAATAAKHGGGAVAPLAAAGKARPRLGLVLEGPVLLPLAPLLLQKNHSGGEARATRRLVRDRGRGRGRDRVRGRVRDRVRVRVRDRVRIRDRVRVRTPRDLTHRGVDV